VIHVYDAAGSVLAVEKSVKHTRILWCVSETVLGMKTIDFFDRLTTPRMTDTKIEIIEQKLLNLANDGDQEAARHYTDLSRARLNWERTRSPEHQQDFIDEAQDAQVWLTVNHH
jgi:hypothetical protein